MNVLAWGAANWRPLLVLGLVLALGGWGLWERGNAAVDAWQKAANAAVRNAATARATAAEASRRAEQLAGRLEGLYGPPAEASAEDQLESIALLLREARR